MRSIRNFAAVGAAAALVLAGCSSGGSTEGSQSTEAEQNDAATESAENTDLAVLTVGASPSPHGKILSFISENLAADAGLQLEIIEFSDYILPNETLEAGELDANFYQTIPYLEAQSEERGYDFVPGAGVHLEPLGIYSEKHTDLAGVPEGATVGVINDPSNQVRALELLASEGFVELPADGKVNVTTVKPLKGIKLIEVEGPSLVRNLQDVDIAVINGNFALEGGLSPAVDALVLEDGTDSPYANLLVWKNGAKNIETIQILEELLHSDEVRQFIESTWTDGSVIPAF
ncbi:MetQ/NlpA family ABC transporter substrate-binding protein [Actinomyces minihominis]|uniref:MetQ/NlpA family ABC transporter substrate-binding protein n=1 Tax=Actinomyces minihominis TaxID=2002838 RepID=UPI000C083306|nr:MetQ/NlpA family ABC transporter substrate-binding protein [Actinomyces minihominis]